MAGIEDLRGVGLFRFLDDAELATIAAHCTLRTVPKGEVLIAEGGAEHDVLVIKRGSIYVSKRTDSGRDRELATLEAETVVGDVSMVLGSPRTASVAAKTEVEVVALSAQGYRDLLDRGDLAAYKVARNLLEVMAQRQLRTNDRLMSFLSTDRDSKVSLEVEQLEQVLGEWGC